MLPKNGWEQQASCREMDPAAWFADPDSEAARVALAICARCTVRKECLDFAVAHDLRHGIFGGKTRRDRLRLHRRVVAAQRAAALRAARSQAGAVPDDRSATRRVPDDPG